MDSPDIKKYTDIAKRRAYWALIPFLAVLLGGFAFALVTEPIYQAETVILVQPQEIPKAYVESIVQSGLQDRLRTITEQVTSRTNLESILSERGLYRDSDAVLEVRVQKFRNDISINTGRGGGRGEGSRTFGISFRHTDPVVARDVTNALASKFITENLKFRDSQVTGTSGFLADEMDAIRRRLEDREEALKQYRDRHFGAMPEQLQANLGMLSRMQSHLDQLSKSLQDAQNRRLLLQQQFANQQRLAEQMAALSGNHGLSDSSSELGKLDLLRVQLQDLQARYTESHPDVRRVKSIIEKLESQDDERPANLQPDENLTAESKTPSLASALGMRRSEDAFKLQLEQVDYEIRRIRQDIARSSERLEMYQKRVEDTPKREQEILSLKRDYDNLKVLHNSLVNRKLEAELSASMERKQKGEQFRILDPARRPEIPIKPDLRRIVLLTIALGMGLGCGLAYFREAMDTSLRDPTEAVESLGLPILVSLPFSYTKNEERFFKIKKWFKAAGVVLGFVIVAAGIVLFTDSLDRVIGIAKWILRFVGIS